MGRTCDGSALHPQVSGNGDSDVGHYSKWFELIRCFYLTNWFISETHPGAVMSVLWMIGQVKEFEPLMASLFWLVLPKLKQKKVAEYLPQVTTLKFPKTILIEFYC